MGHNSEKNKRSKSTVKERKSKKEAELIPTINQSIHEGSDFEEEEEDDSFRLK